MGFIASLQQCQKKSRNTGAATWPTSLHREGKNNKGKGESQERILSLQSTRHAARGRSGRNRGSVQSAFGPWTVLGPFSDPTETAPVMRFPRHREHLHQTRMHCAGDKVQTASGGGSCLCQPAGAPGPASVTSVWHQKAWGGNVQGLRGSVLLPRAAGCTEGVDWWLCHSSRLLRPAAAESGVRGASGREWGSQMR